MAAQLPARPSRGLKSLLLLYVAATIAGSVAAFAVAVADPLALAPSVTPAPWVLAVLLLSALAFEYWRTDIFGDTTVSLSFVPIFATALLFGPAHAAAVGALAMLPGMLAARRVPLHKALFSSAAVALAAIAASTLFHLAAGESSTGRVLQQAIPAAGGGLLMFAVNSVLVAGAVALETRRGIVSVWMGTFRWLTPHYLVLTLAAHAMSLAYLTLGVSGASIFILPVASLWFAVRQYTNRTRADVMRIQRTSTALKRSEQRFRSLVENAPGVIAVINPDGTLQSLVPPGPEGEDEQPPPAADIQSLVHPLDVPRVEKLMIELRESPGAELTTELRLRHGDEWRDYAAIMTDLTDTEAVGGIVLNAHDVAERKALERQLRYMAFHDPLTRLPNRALFTDRLEHALETAPARGVRVAVLFLDLDRFKAVNDSLGHNVGDELLVRLARRMAAAVRSGDTISRWGGDEFTVLLEGVWSAEEATAFAERLLSAVAEPVEIDGDRIVPSVSIGIAVSEDDRLSPRDLIRNADVALFRAKAAGGHRAVLFDEALDQYSIERFQLEADLRDAIENGQLVAHYQPEIDLQSGAIVGFEALVRWQHPTRGLIPPDDFIPLAEETGEIINIGQWILAEACRQAAKWQRDLFATGPFTMSVNFSAKEFLEPGVVARVERTLAETGLDPSALRIEVTESIFLGDTSVADETFHDIKQLGVALAIDDFGTGYSSLSYLRRLPADVLKIDRSFVATVDRDEREEAIVRAVIAVGKALGMLVVVEGIERAEQLAKLTTMGCHTAQGFYFCRPLPAAEIETFVAQSRDRRDVA
ncbi:MAG: EAL domain-containing protein [Dehalococcoidia bacterium]